MRQNPYYEKQVELARRQKEQNNRRIHQKYRRKHLFWPRLKKLCYVILVIAIYTSQMMPHIRAINASIPKQQYEFVRNVPYREIDISALPLISDPDVSDSCLQRIEEAAELVLGNTYLKRHFIGNNWQIYVTNQPLPRTNDIDPAGITDTGERQISLLASQVDHAIYHEFGHYFMAMYTFNFPDAEDRLNELYSNENSQFQSYTGMESDSLYGQSNAHEFIASVFDNMVHGSRNICPETEAYLEQMYQTLSQMDYSEVYSTGYSYHKDFENMLINYGASYTILLDGSPIDPVSYDIHDLPDSGYTTSIHDLGGHGTVFVQSSAN